MLLSFHITSTFEIPTVVNTPQLSFGNRAPAPRGIPNRLILNNLNLSECRAALFVAGVGIKKSITEPFVEGDRGQEALVRHVPVVVTSNVERGHNALNGAVIVVN